MDEFSNEFLISASDTAKFMRSGSLDVLATPACIAMAENTCLLLSEKMIEKDETTVGTFVEFHHLKPSSIGQTVLVNAKLSERNANKQTFKFSIYQEAELIGYGQHVRYVVNKSTFMKKLSD